jgi:hypothetical protein
VNRTYFLFGSVFATILMLLIPAHLVNASSCSASSSSVMKHRGHPGGGFRITFSSPTSCSVATGSSTTSGGFENFGGKSSCAGESAGHFPSGSGGSNSGNGGVSCNLP